MIAGIGSDLIEVERIARLVEKHGERFFERLLHPEESAYVRSHQAYLPILAARFAAKEAIAKALGVGIGEQLGWLDMKICKEPSGKPFVELSEAAFERFNRPKIHLTLSHCDAYATATALVEH